MYVARLVIFLLMASTGAAATAQPVRAPTVPPAVPPADPAVKRGVDLWQAGDYGRAVAAWRTPADRGDADAQFNLAQAYKLGRGVTLDQRIAERWYRKAAEQGHEQAGGYLGLIMFQNGDRIGAMPWLDRAADKGDPRAQYLYGTALFNGENVIRDWPRAYAMMMASAAAGLPQAVATLKQMDEFIPPEDRQRGLKRAQDARRAPPPVETVRMVTTTAAPAAPPPVGEPAPVRTAAAQAARPALSPVQKPQAHPAAPAGRWRIQVGAYGSEAGARTAWATLRATPALARLSPIYQKAGAVVRLQLGPLPDRAAATRLCNAARVPACFPVTG